MKKIQLAVCSRDADFSVRFMTRINCTPSSPFFVHAFTDVPKMIRHLKEKKTDVLLLDPVLLPLVPDPPPADFVILLSETKDYSGPYPSVCKYQPAADLANGILLLIRTESALPSGSRGRPHTIGVYSPAGRLGKTSFALVLSAMLGRREPVLFLSLEDTCTLPDLTGCVFGETLSDLIFTQKEDPGRFSDLLASSVRTAGGVSFLPPPAHPEELSSLTAPEWDDFYSALLSSAPHSVLFIDIGSGMGALPSVLAILDRLYVPVRNDLSSRLKVRLFEEKYLHDDGAVRADAVKKITLPAFRFPETADRFTEQLLRTELAPFAAALL